MVNMTDDVVYRSHVRVVREKGPRRHAELPANDQPVYFGVHGEVAAYYGTDMSQHEPLTTTLDYVVAAATG
jgi:hypothetical protein